jgi:MoaA/NifB/PqqE/SkfB family radical SAM enzyme
MSFYLRKIKVTLLELWRSPAPTMVRLCRKPLVVFKKREIDRLRKATRQAPLMLQIETINVCNAECIFCAYPGMTREKGVMSMPLFEKVVLEYAQMGGGAISLTPIVGDALLDPHLMDRLRVIKSHPAVTQITLTTNAIALDKYSDGDVRTLLESLYCVQVSLGGLDADTYRRMYGVDRFQQVERAIGRLLTLNATVANPANISLAFRTSDWNFTNSFEEKLAEFKQQGAFVSHLWAYANYGGRIDPGAKIGLTVMDSQVNKRRTCIFPRVHSAVSWDGTVTACACTDLECTQLKLGHLLEERLSAILSGEKRAGLLDTFEKGVLAKICQNCSAYQPDTIFAAPPFKDAGPNNALPLDFFRNIMT